MPVCFHSGCAVHIRLICAPPRNLPTHLSAAHTRRGLRSWTTRAACGRSVRCCCRTVMHKHAGKRVFHGCTAAWRTGRKRRLRVFGCAPTVPLRTYRSSAHLPFLCAPTVPLRISPVPRPVRVLSRRRVMDARLPMRRWLPAALAAFCQVRSGRIPRAGGRCP
jgi:hypothetical protein